MFSNLCFSLYFTSIFFQVIQHHAVPEFYYPFFFCYFCNSSICLTPFAILLQLLPNLCLLHCLLYQLLFSFSYSHFRFIFSFSFFNNHVPTKHSTKFNCFFFASSFPFLSPSTLIFIFESRTLCPDLSITSLLYLFVFQFNLTRTQSVSHSTKLHTFQQNFYELFCKDSRIFVQVLVHY